MERIGCGIWLALFFVLPFLGLLSAIKHHDSRLLGFSRGAIAWLALISGYMVMLSIIDWRRRPRIPRENDEPKWVVPLAWTLFITASVVSVLLWK
jgi:hypothetical protein